MDPRNLTCVRHRSPADRLSPVRTTRRHLLSCFVIGLLGVQAAGGRAAAQPSGGPYGPIGHTYAIPTTAGRVFYVAVDGTSQQSGETPGQPTTLASAIDRVNTGDAIIMRGGTYRTGGLRLNQGITIQPYADEHPVLKGTLVATTWSNLGNGLWTASWPHLFPAKPADWWQRNREGKKTPLYLFNNDMVFVDGRFLQAVGREGEVGENSYYIDYDAGMVYIGTDPANRVVEITAFDVALLRTTGECHGKKSDHKGYVIRGVTFSEYAYRALEVEGTEPEGISDESSHGKEVVGTTLEDCTISYCSRVAGYFRGDRLTMRHCRVSDTSTEGVYIIASNDVLLEQNIFTRNNIEQITGYYPAAVKIFNQSHRVTCRDNLVIDLPHSNGIWYDVGNADGVFVNNRVEGVGNVGTTIRTDQLWPSDNGFFFEISTGAICAGNVFVNCDHGVMVLNSSNVRIVQNTFVNSTACIGRNGRVALGDRFGWHASTGPGIDKRDGHTFVNNLLTGDRNFGRPLLFVWQPESLCTKLTKPLLMQLDHNVYVRAAENPAYPLILWSPASGVHCQAAMDSPDQLRKVDPAFSVNSRVYADYDGPLYKCGELGDYRILAAFPGWRSGMQIPATISTLLGDSGKGGVYVGAFAPVQ